LAHDLLNDVCYTDLNMTLTSALCDLNLNLGGFELSIVNIVE